MKIITLTLLLSITSLAKRESEYQKEWAETNGGQLEYRLPDRTRCDILTETHAIEVDFAPKWSEAFGQALWYSFQTGKKPGIVLILRKKADRKHLIRLESLIQHHQLDIKVWVIDDI